MLETGASGVVRHGASTSSLILDRVEKDEMVDERQHGASPRAGQTERFESLFPRGIPIGVVESVGQQDVDLFKRIQIAPLVDFDSLAVVIVLIEKEPAQPRRQNQQQGQRQKRQGQQQNGAGRQQETTTQP